MSVPLGLGDAHGDHSTGEVVRSYTLSDTDDNLDISEDACGMADRYLLLQLSCSGASALVLVQVLNSNDLIKV